MNGYGMSEDSVIKLIGLMDRVGYDRIGGMNFLERSGGKMKTFMSWGEVYDFVRAKL